MALLRSAINTSAMLRALADLAEQFPCSCPDLMIDSTGPVISFGDTFNQKPTASRISAAFEIGVADFELRMAYGIAYKRHSGEGGPDWAEEAEDAPGDSETVQELIRDNKALGDGLDRLVVRCTQLSEANTEHVARIAMLENGLREMAELALHEIEQQKTQLDEELIIGMSDDELQARGLRKSLQLAGRKTQIDELLRHCGLTTSTTPTP
jgi:hypothetical protein